MNDLKRFMVTTTIIVACVLGIVGCGQNTIAAWQREKEANTAKYRSTYAVMINKLELEESDFKTYRRVIFYNVRLGETVFACEGFCHIQVDRDGDIEIVVKTEDGKFLRHYLGQKQDITYFSEQLKPTEYDGNYRYQIIWNPKLWFPEFTVAE